MREGGGKMSINKLKAKCVENGLSLSRVAVLIGLSPATLYRKVKKNTFTVAEVIDVAERLRLDANDIINIFFESFVA